MSVPLNQSFSSQQPLTLDADPFRLTVVKKDWPSSLVVPNEVMQGYLRGFSPQDLKEFAEEYIAYRNKVLAGKSKTTTSTNVGLFIGNAGSGKSTLNKNLLSKSKLKPVICSTDDFLDQISAYEHACRVIQNQATEYPDAHKHVRAELGHTTNRFRPIAQFMTDRLIEECLKNGIPFNVEVTGKSTHIASFIQGIQNAGGLIKTYLCLTPESVALQVNQRRWESDTPICANEKAVKDAQEQIFENIGTILNTVNGDYSVLSRSIVDAPLKTLISRTGNKIEVTEGAEESLKGLGLVQRDLVVEKPQLPLERTLVM